MLFSFFFFNFKAGATDGSPSRYSVVEKDLILAAPEVARTDGVGGRWCGRGTLSVLTSLGLAQGLRSADGHDWEAGLWEAGWRPIFCKEPITAPYGSVLVYDSDYHKVGFNRRGTAGGRWGHVEFVSWDKTLGGRVYVSDAARKTPGGSVLNNFNKRAWVPPSFVSLYLRLRGGPLPFAGYVYSGPKVRPDSEYVLVGGGYFGYSPGLGRGGADDIELGPSPGGGPNPRLGTPVFEETIDMGISDSLGVDRPNRVVRPIKVVESEGVVQARLELLLAMRVREAASFFSEL